MPLVTCPTREELSSYVLGKLPDDSSAAFDEHLLECTKCQTALETLAISADSLLADLQRPAAEQEYFAESECHEAMALVQAIGRDPSIAEKPAADSVVAESQDLGQIRDYKLLAKLGEGGMGTVYKALHIHLNKVVALKLLPKQQTTDEQAVARFKREMLAVGALEHPNIVRATDAGEHEGIHFLVMEYVKGQDLSKISKQHGPLPVAEACELVQRAAIGLQHAHEAGLIHRDIKPSNLMLTDTGEVKILDLGLALLQENQADNGRDLTSTGQMMGTLDYMAPEQGDDSHEVDIRADIYSLGATLYKLLCGEAPFGGPKYNTPVKKLMALATEEPQSIVKRRDDLPTGLAEVVHKMLAKDPNARYGTPAQGAAALAPFAANTDLAALVGWGSPTEAEQRSDTSPSISASTPTPPTVPRPQGRSGLGLTNIHSTQPLERPVRPRPDLHYSGDSPTLEHPVEKVGLADSPQPTTTTVGAWIRSPRVLAVGAGFFGVLVAAAMFTIRTPKGTVEIEIADEYKNDVSLVIDGGGERIELSNETGWQIRLHEGRYDIALQGSSDRFKIDHDTVNVTRRGHQVVRVTLKRDAVTQVQTAPSAVGQPKSGGPLKLTLHATLDKHETAVRSLAFSPDGRVLATIGAYDRGQLHVPRVACLWDTKSLDSRVIDRTSGHSGFYTVEFSPNGERVAIGKDHSLIFFDVATGNLERKIEMEDNVWEIKFLADDGPLLVMLEHSIVRVDLSGKIIGEYEIKTEQTQYLWALAISPDRTQFVTGGNYRATIEFWDVAKSTPRAIAKHNHTTAGRALAFSPDGKAVASGGFGNLVQIWSAADGTLRHELKLEGISQVNTIEYSPDGLLLVIGGLWRTLAEQRAGRPGVGRIEVWSTDFKHRLALREDHPGAVLDVAFSPDGKQLATASTDTTVKLWDIHDEGLTTSAADNPETVPQSATSDKQLNLATQTPGLVGHWSFDEGEGMTASDSSGKGHHGTLKNMDRLAWVTVESDDLPPVPGNRAALKFDGDDDVVTVPYDAALDLDGPFTLSAWIRRPAEPEINRYERIIDHHFVNGYAFVLMNMKGLKGQTAMHIAGGNAIAYNSHGPSVMDGKWHHVAAVCDGSELRIYQDGKPLIKGRIKRSKPTTEAPLAFGNNASSLPGEEGFHGMLDEIRIYNRELSDAEIKALASGK